MKQTLLLLLLLAAIPAAAQPPSSSTTHGTKASIVAVKELLSSHPWRMQMVTMADGRTMGESKRQTLEIHGVDRGTRIDTVLQSDSVDMTLTFRNDGSFLINVQLPGYSEQENGTWKLSSDGTRITLSEENRQARKYSIERLDSAQVRLSESHIDIQAQDDEDSITRYDLVPRD